MVKQLLLSFIVTLAILVTAGQSFGGSNLVANGHKNQPVSADAVRYVADAGAGISPAERAVMVLESEKVQVTATSITTNALGSLKYCAGSSLSVTFKKQGDFNSGNTFTAQLSDATGSFAHATVIGTGNSSPIAAAIPIGAAQGAGYRVRVIASSPATAGTNNGSNITINAMPEAPVTTAAEHCGTGIVTLAASGAPKGGSYRWYTSVTGGTAISGATKNTYTTPSLSQTTTYYVSVVNSSKCESLRTAVKATINAVPAAPAVTAGERCGPGTVVLTASGAPAGGSYRWYTTATGGVVISGATGSSITTPGLNATTTYYVAAVSGAACESGRTAVTATVKAVPNTPIATTSPVQVGGTLRLGASTISGATYSWSGPNGFTSTLQLPSIPNATVAHSGTYSVVATLKGCSSVAGTVNVTVVDVPPVTFDADSVSGLANTEVLVHVRVKEFTNIRGIQYSINWDASIATFVGVEGFGVSSLSAVRFNTSQAATGKVTLSWNDPYYKSYTLPDSAILFKLRLNLTGAEGQSTPVAITGIPTSVVVSEQNGFIVPVTSLAGAATIRKLIKISGKIKAEQGQGIRTVSVTATGGIAAIPFETEPDGLYEVDVMQNGTYTISPFKNNDAEAYNGITAQDIALIRRHIVNITPLASAYKLLAADVDQSNSVTTTDIEHIQRVILTSDTYFPKERLWTFVPDTYHFANPADPFPFTDTVKVYTNIVQPLANQDFIGVKLGDVNNNWDASMARLSAAGNNTARIAGEISVKLHDQQVLPGAEVLVPVKAYDFRNVSGYQFTLNWNPEVLEFVAVEHAAATGAFGTHRVSEGILTTVWDEPTGKSVSTPEGSTIFYVKFKAIGQLDTETELEINSALTPSVAYNLNLEQLNIVVSNAKLKIRSTAYTPAPGYNLYQNVPNPVRQDNTTIRFSIPQQEEVSISVYTPLGQLIKTYSEVYAAGEHEIVWDGRNNSGQSLGPGTYLYYMRAGKFTAAKRALILK